MLGSPRPVNMKKENLVNANAREVPDRVTRSRTAALVASQQIPPLKAPIQQNKKRALQTNPKRAANDENNSNACLQRKKRVVLQDVTNVCCDHSYRTCFNKTKIQVNKVFSRYHFWKLYY